MSDGEWMSGRLSRLRACYRNTGFFVIQGVFASGFPGDGAVLRHGCELVDAEFLVRGINAGCGGPDAARPVYPAPAADPVSRSHVLLFVVFCVGRDPGATQSEIRAALPGSISCLSTRPRPCTPTG